MPRLIAIICVSLLLSPGLSSAFTLSDFEVPESVVRDPQDGAYYVSNINGEPTAKDGNGYISKISSSGNVLIQRYIGGEKGSDLLHAPKGLLVLRGELWVTDIDTIKVFNKTTKELLRTLDLTPFGAKFLNDLAFDPSRGTVYVSDMLGDRIYSIEIAREHRIEIFKEGEELDNPNGIMINPRSKNLLAVTWKGKIIEIDRQKRVRILKKGLTTLDGVDHDGKGSLYVSSFDKGEIYRIDYYGRGSATTVFSGLTTPADISFDRQGREVLVPSFKSGTVTTLSVRRASEKNPSGSSI
ncbi:MAG: hypothetical protein MOGMAGMI_00568 [Candidatus Omnitrophica bacterium]|nr:hypothetical protein [Candidatus Omnitrophota bacterium]